MNSKLYQRYLSLKIENSELLYLFKSKNYYFFIADDALKVSPLLNLNLTNLNSIIVKCGFSLNFSERYFKKLDNLKIDYKIVLLPEDIFNYDLERCYNSTKLNDFLSNFLDVKINELSISQAYDLLRDFQKKLKRWYKY